MSLSRTHLCALIPCPNWAYLVLCLKAALNLNEGLTLHSDVVQAQFGPVVEQGPWKGVGVERVRDHLPFPAAMHRASAKYFQSFCSCSSIAAEGPSGKGRQDILPGP